MTCPDLLHITGMGSSGHNNNSMGFNFQNSPTDNTGSRSPSSSSSSTAIGSEILDRTTHDLKLEKSNILLLGPTGSGEFNRIYLMYIEY